MTWVSERLWWIDRGSQPVGTRPLAHVKGTPARDSVCVLHRRQNRLAVITRR